MTTKTNKRFDAVAESRKWRLKTSALLAKMTPEEQMAFLNQRIERFRPAPAPKAPSASST